MALNDIDYFNGTGFVNDNILTRSQLDYLYTRFGLCRKVCDVIPTLMGDAWGEIVFEDEVDTTAIDEQLEALRRVYVEGQIMANLYGGSTAIRYVEGEDWSTPLMPRVGMPLTYTRIFDRWEIYPDSTDFQIQLDPANPKAYQFTLLIDGVNEVGTIDASRIVRFRGDKLPPFPLIQNNYWDLSILQAFYQPFVDYQDAVDNASKALKSFSLPVFKKKNLLEIFGQEFSETSGVKERLSSVFRELSSDKGVSLDSETEELDFLDRSFGGIDGVIESLKNNMVAVSGLTKPQLLSEHPAGLNATGESERLAEAQKIQALQESTWGALIRKDIQILLATMGIVDGYSWQWISSYESSPLETATIRNQQADMDNKYITMGVLSVEEVRQSRFGESEFSLETTLIEGSLEAEMEAKIEYQKLLQPDPQQPEQTTTDEDTILVPENKKFVVDGQILPQSFYDDLLQNLEEVEVS